MLALLPLAAACEGALDVDPAQSIPRDRALGNVEEIRAAANGMYDAFQQCDGGYCRNTILYPDLYADNLSFTGTFATDREVWQRNILATNAALPGIWQANYRAINRANNVLAALPNVAGLAAAERTRLEGEALFIRALGHMNLVNFFGGVPIFTTPTWEAGPEANVPRNTAAEVWTQIEADLQAAITRLPAAHSNPNFPAGRARRSAAQGLLARAYLYQRKWQQAHDMADAVIRTGPHSLLANYAEVFENEQTAESILELRFSVTDANALAFWFYPSSLGGRRGIAPTASLIAAFHASDSRRLLASGTSPQGAYGRKFTDVANGGDDVPVLRLAEMYLIRSEAAARLGRFDDAIADINRLRARAGAPLLDATGMSQNDVLWANLEERRLELFFEGHRFFDLRRFNDVPSVANLMTTLGLTGHRLLFPIPQREIDANTALQGAQNPGY